MDNKLLEVSVNIIKSLELKITQVPVSVSGR